MDGGVDVADPVTVLIPVLNGMPYLRQTLASIAAQRCRGFEVLLWDNGSTDGTVEEARRWVPARLPGRVVADRPLPLGRCRAAMVEAAATDLIAWVDADDLIDPDRLRLQVEAFACDPMLGAVGSRLRYVDAEGRDLPGEFPLPMDDASIRWRIRFATAMVQGTAMLRRSVVLQAGNYRDLKPAQDTDLFVRMAALAPMRNLPQKLLAYRQHGESVTARRSEDAHAVARRIARDHESIVFPGIGAEAGLRLRALLRPGSDEDARLSDLRAHRRLAIAAARAVGRDERYFQRTPLYPRQRRVLWRSWLRRNPAARAAWRLARTPAALRAPRRAAA